MSSSSRAPETGAFIIAGDWLLADSRTEISGGQVRVERGFVTHVGRDLTSAFPQEPVRRLPGCVVMPGLVNAHTHLELTGLRGAVRAESFPDWIAAVTAEVLSRERREFADGAEAGAWEMAASGVTSIGDHSTFGLSAGAISRRGLSGVVFKEAFCPDSADAPAVTDELEADIGSMRNEAGANVEMGVSCHAPYNAPQQFIETVIKRMPNLPRSIHVAESQDELLYIRSATGEIARRHVGRGIGVKPHNMSPVEYLDNCSYWNRGAVAVHLAAATQGDLAVLKNRGVSCVFCPVSNALLGNGSPPIAAALEMGLECCLGTDSAMSNPGQDMFEEMRFAVLSARLRKKTLSDEQVFDMVTIGGARALGLQRRGQIRESMAADIVAVKLGKASSAAALSRVVWEASASDVRAVWAGGRLSYDSERPV